MQQLVRWWDGEGDADQGEENPVRLVPKSSGLSDLLLAGLHFEGITWKRY